MDQWPSVTCMFWRSCPECRARSCARSLSFYSTDLGQCRRREHALWQYWRWPMFQQAGGHVDHPRQAVAAFGVVCCISTWGACNLSGSICIAALSQVCKYVWSVNGLQVFSFLEFHVRGWGYYTYMSHMYYVFGSLMRYRSWLGHVSETPLALLHTRSLPLGCHFDIIGFGSTWRTGQQSYIKGCLILVFR